MHEVRWIAAKHTAHTLGYDLNLAIFIAKCDQIFVEKEYWSH